MCFARSVWVIRNSVRHFRIVFPGASERVISPAIFSRKTLCTVRAHKGPYIRMSKYVSANRERPPEDPTPAKIREARVGTRRSTRRTSELGAFEPPNGQGWTYAIAPSRLSRACAPQLYPLRARWGGEGSKRPGQQTLDRCQFRGELIHAQRNREQGDERRADRPPRRRRDGGQTTKAPNNAHRGVRTQCLPQSVQHRPRVGRSRSLAHDPNLVCVPGIRPTNPLFEGRVKHAPVRREDHRAGYGD